MSRSFTFATEEYYHCYSRGTEKRKIFLDKKDYERFIALLFTCNSSKTIHLSDYPKKSLEEILDIKRENSLIEIGAYCLMPNHFHLLVREKEENGISLFMQKIMTAYTMYFNKKYEHTGSLFESRFRAEHADKDQYLKYLFSYIHLNPIKLIDSRWKENSIKNIQKANEFLLKYDYSSYLDYLKDSRPNGVILNKEAFPIYFDNPNGFKEEIFEWLDVKVQP